jgi:hypothetical protein
MASNMNIKICFLGTLLYLVPEEEAAIKYTLWLFSFMEASG